MVMGYDNIISHNIVCFLSVESETFGSAYLGVTGSHDCSIKIWSLGDGK